MSSCSCFDTRDIRYIELYQKPVISSTEVSGLLVNLVSSKLQMILEGTDTSTVCKGLE